MEVAWQEISDGHQKYKAYLCSREWAEKRQAVVKRANGVCERCGLSKVEEIHHKSYDRLFDEPVEDLQGLCAACHKYVGNYSDFDPASLNAFRSAPRNLDAEMALIASMLLMNEVIDDVIGVVSSQSFYGDMNRRIADVVFHLHKAGVGGIDAVTVAEELSRRSQIDDSGVEYLRRVLAVPASPTNAIEYAKIVRSKANLRTVIYELSRIVDRAYVAEEGQVLSEAESALFALSDKSSFTQTHPLASCMVEVIEALDRRISSAESVFGVSSGFADLDAQTNGFQPGELVILAARPSMGKTALFCNFLRAGATTLVFSLEQSRTELSERLMIAEARINSHCLRSGNFTEDQHNEFIHACAIVEKLPVFIDDSGARSVAEIRSLSRRVHRKHGLQLIVIDYLQLIQPEDNRVPREQQVATITRQLKCLAKELLVPVIAVSQLNRAVEMREDKRPRLADLRESGAIEQDADMVMFLHRPDAYDPEDRPGEAEVIVAKHRNGPTGLVRLMWEKECLRFDDYCPKTDNDFNL